MKKACLLVAVLALVAVCAAPVAASPTAAIQTVGTIANNSGGFDGSAGYLFTTEAASMTVTSLGYFDFSAYLNSGTPGLTAVHNVAIFDVAGSHTTPLVSANVSNSNPMDSSLYHWTSVAATTLEANHQYVMMAYFGLADSPYITITTDGLGRVLNPNVTLGQGVYKYTGAGNVPAVYYDTTNGAEQYLMGNFDVAAVPEPATMGLLGLGLIGLISRRKK